MEAGPDLIVTTDVNISGASSAGSSLSFEWTSSNPSVVSFSDATILNPVVTVTSDGVYTLQLKSTEGINNTVLTDTLTLIKDTTPPVLADLADETSTLGVGFSKTADVTDESSGLASGLWEKVLGTGNVVFSNPTATTTTITPDTTSGSYTIKYTATDNAGYTVSNTFTFVWDISVLTANITSHTNIYTASSESLSGTANGDSVLWTAVDSKVKFTSATTSSTDVSIDPSTEEGVYTIKFTTSRGADSAEDTMELHWDLTPPQIDTPIALDGATVGGYINEDDVDAAEFSLVTTGVSSDPNNTSGILSEEYLLTLASEACSSIANNDSRWTEIVPKNTDLNVLADGFYHVCFRSTDRSFRITLQTSAPSFTLDTSDPAYVSGFALETNIADGYLNKK